MNSLVLCLYFKCRELTLTFTSTLLSLDAILTSCLHAARIIHLFFFPIKLLKLGPQTQSPEFGNKLGHDGICQFFLQYHLIYLNVSQGNPQIMFVR